MRRFLRIALLTPMIAGGLVLIPGRADAITLQEIVAMSRAGLGDEVLLALIEVDRRVFPIDPDTLNALKDAGVSERVIVAIVKSGRTPAPAPAATPEPVDPAPTPTDPLEPELKPDVVIRERPVYVPVPTYVAVPTYIAVGGDRHTGHRTVTTTTYPRTPFNPFGPIDTSTPVIIQQTVAQQTVAQQTVDTPPPPPRKAAEPVYWGWGGKLRPDAWKPR